MKLYTHSHLKIPLNPSESLGWCLDDRSSVYFFLCCYRVQVVKLTPHLSFKLFPTLNKAIKWEVSSFKNKAVPFVWCVCIVPKSAAIFVMLEGLYASVLENGATLVNRESLQTITRWHFVKIRLSLCENVVLCYCFTISDRIFKLFPCFTLYVSFDYTFFLLLVYILDLFIFGPAAFYAKERDYSQQMES